MAQISKSDWKLFKERVGVWQERYMEGLLRQYAELIDSPTLASERFWELEKRIKKDRRHMGVLVDLKKTEVVWDIAIYIKEEIITMKDLDGFSEELVEAVKVMLKV